jgi:hypothetical protein
MAYPFRPLTNEDLEEISRQIKELILALRRSKKRFVVSFPENILRIQNKTSVFE